MTHATHEGPRPRSIIFQALGPLSRSTRADADAEGLPA